MADDTTIHDALAGLRNADAATRAAAAEAICHAGDAASLAAVPLVHACGDPDERVREWAVAALEDLGTPSATTIPSLMTIAAAAQPLAAYWAITLLGRSGEAAAAAVPVLGTCLASDDTAVAQRAAWALGKVGPASLAVRDELKAAATSTDPRLAAVATATLATLGGI